MKYRPLGHSGINASTVAFGAWAIGGWQWGGTDDDEAISAIHAFLDVGGNLIDTAPIYGFGRSEEVVAKAIKGRRDDVVIATKCAMRWDLTDEQKKRAFHFFNTGPDAKDAKPNTDVYIYNGRDGIREEIDRSLKRLGVDHIDLYQTHWQQDATPIEERMGALEELRQEGKIRAIGVCNASTDLLAQYAGHGTLDTDQEKYSMLDRDMESTNLPHIAQHNIAFLAYSPLAQGLLTGKITPDREYDEGDQRRRKDRFKPDNVRKVQSMLDPMRPIADKHAISLAQLTQAWTLAQPGCSHVLCGARNAKQATDNAGASDVELTQDELDIITAAVDAYNGV
jgi:aryl-alcohol dehydrogenase-like predicted oxidoreductase